GAAWPVEVTGGGVGLLDYDGDGDLDLFFAQGVPLPVGTSKNPPADVLLRNDGHGQFTDVSAAVGLTSKGYGQGVTVADHDGGGPEYGPPANFEGQPDVLYRNDGHGHFTDVTARAGVAGKGRGMGVLAADFDGDGRIDFFVANDAEANALWRNKGDGTFEDV